MTDEVNDALGVSDDAIAEQSYLVARGVRPLALLGHVTAESMLMLKVSTRIETLAEVTVVPFVSDRGTGVADVGYAAAPWVADLFRWASHEAEEPHLGRILGLLLGYSAYAISEHESRQSRRWFTEPISSSVCPISSLPPCYIPNMEGKSRPCLVQFSSCNCNRLCISLMLRCLSSTRHSSLLSF